MFLFGEWYQQLHYDVKDKNFSLIQYFWYAKPLFPEALGYKRLNRWEVLVTLEKSLFPFPGFSNLSKITCHWDKPSWRDTQESEFVPDIRNWCRCVTQEGHIVVLEKTAKVLKHATKKEEKGCYTFTTTLFWNRYWSLPPGHSRFYSQNHFADKPLCIS